MKHIKKFETTDKPQINDYVICHEEYDDDVEGINTFLDNNIGQIIGRFNNNDITSPFLVKYENIPNDIGYMFNKDKSRQMLNYEIIHFSKNKEDLEHVLSANKYNL